MILFSVLAQRLSLGNTSKVNCRIKDTSRGPPVKNLLQLEVKLQVVLQVGFNFKLYFKLGGSHAYFVPLGYQILLIPNSGTVEFRF
jgi:hypothetical protein